MHTSHLILRPNKESNMSKTIRITTLCMLAILLLSMISFTVARPIPTFKDVTPVETLHTEEEVAKANAVENCSGPGEEECLMRRTLAAHLDYIYTKKHQP
ncbi:putative phytosulfokine [Helianthus debilis subsp. tardiflorus]